MTRPSFTFSIEQGPLAFLLEPIQGEFDLDAAARRLRAVAAGGVGLDSWWPRVEPWVVMSRASLMESSKPVTSKGRTAAQIVVQEGDLRWLAALQRAGADVHAHDEAGQPSISVAVRQRSLAAVDALLALGADIESPGENGHWLDTEKPLGYTPLMIAAMSDDAAMCRALVQRGARIEARADERELTPLLVAIHSNAARAARALLESGADANVCDRYQCNALYRAIVISRSVELMLALLEHGARPVAIVSGAEHPMGELGGLCQTPGIEDAWRVHCARQAAHAAAQDMMDRAWPSGLF